MQSDLDAVDPHFARDLLASVEAAEASARWIDANWGVSCVVPDVVVRPDPAVRMEYRDDGDVLLEDGRIVQAKQRPTIDFQSLGDFPHDFVIVDRKHNVDLADRAASHYFIWNASLTGFLLLACRPSRKYWVPSWIDSAARGRAAWYYIAAIHHFEYHHAE